MDHLHLLLLTICLLSVLGVCIACPKSCLCHAMTKSVTCPNGYSSSLVNLVSSVPKDVQHVQVYGAHFRHISFEVQQLKKLKVLTLQNCRIMSIASSAFRGLHNLTEIHLDDNMIGDLHEYSFKGLDSLRVLNLSTNAVENLRVGIFSDLVNLRVLDMNNNKLRNIPANLFVKLQNLEILDLGDNALDFIHPLSFTQLKLLSVVKINSNYLQTFHEMTFQNNTLIKQIDLYENPWDCNCGLRWLLSDILDPKNSKMYPNKYKIKCASPYKLHSVQLPTLKLDALQCVEPEIQTPPYKISVVNQHNAVLHCNASGYPRPAIVWVTPRGKLLAHPRSKHWININMTGYETEQTFAGKPTYFESKVSVHPNGSLLVSHLRFYFAGEYMCMAMNPGGLDVNIVSIKITSVMKKIFIGSLYVSAASALGMLIIGIMIGLIRLICEKFCCKDQKGLKLEIEEKLQGMGLGDHPEILDISPPKSPWHKRSLYDIYEGEGVSGNTTDYEDYYSTDGSNIKETLDEVKKRLRTGVDKSVEKMRTRAQHLRESTNLTMHALREKGHTIKSNASQSVQTIRQSASHSMSTLKRSSSEYATRLRTGVVLGVEQVKYHVQSMKEFCGTGDIGQTVSCVSMSTDVDSQERSEVFRTVTSV